MTPNTVDAYDPSHPPKPLATPPPTPALPGTKPHSPANFLCGTIRRTHRRNRPRPILLSTRFRACKPWIQRTQLLSNIQSGLTPGTERAFDISQHFIIESRLTMAMHTSKKALVRTSPHFLYKIKTYETTLHYPSSTVHHAKLGPNSVWNRRGSNDQNMSDI